MSLSEEEYRETIERIYSTPRSRKWRYHKDHFKHLQDGNSSFNDWWKILVGAEQ